MSQSKHNPIADMAKDAELEHLFSTPILKYVLPDVESLNDSLRELILEREKSTPSESKSNQGGWQSSGDFFRWGGSAVNTLSNYIQKALDIATAKLNLPDNFKFEFEFYGWAAVNRKGNYNTSHCHPMSTWSGIYYVDPGDHVDGGNGGLLELSHPVNASVMSFFPAILPPEITIKPEAGMLILFPSYLQHSVRAYWGERPRISVPFNAHARLTAM
ncbi:MAG: 2OG-Fe(II) oxygenase family protein [Gammaproteobacteria bacterium]|nr:2OG-Fe(II) oxygenase family protein [Gammaproteobacteria bacterium]MCI0591780.1 2OG-Fe(II) oxygenase family protein [Gammaproteobacteria bacterium]